MRKARVYITVWALSVAVPLAAAATEAPPYFYRGLSYGSDAVFHPVSEIVNGALGVLQISTSWATLDEIDWRHGLDMTWRSISHPIATVNAYGWGDFMTSEVLPGQYRWNNLQYLPNYHLHMIGGGARHRGFIEWYRAHGFDRPGWWAAATTMVHAFAVETVEHHDADRPTVDPVADMLIFDPAGAILFSSESVTRFFAHTLNMSIWSGQPMYNPALNSVENAGQNYGLHFFFAEDHRVGIFQYWGMSDLMGVTVRQIGGMDWSVGLGGAVDELLEFERRNGSTAFTARLKLDGGVFLHRNGSLLASLMMSQSWTQRLRINVFPGAIRWRGISPGFYLGVRDESVIVGLRFTPVPLGLAGSW